MPQAETAAEWISAREAVNRLSLAYGGDTEAKLLVADRLRDGQLQARAKRCATGRDMGRVNAEVPVQSETSMGTGFARIVIKSAVGGSVILGAAFWSWSTDWEADQKRWQWGPGIFVVSARGPKVTRKSTDGAVETVFSKPPERMVAYGVEFLASEIDRILEVGHIGRAAPTPEARAPAKKVSARLWDWEPALIDLMLIADLDGLEEYFGAFSVRGSQKKLELWFAAWFQGKFGEEPSVQELRKRAQRIIAALRQREAG